MARRLSTNFEIDDFIANIFKEAKHHAPNVKSVIQPLSDQVRRRLNMAVDVVAVYERNGKLARTCWVTLNGKRYVFSYNYSKKQIVMRRGTLRGYILFEFDHATSIAQIQSAVATM